MLLRELNWRIALIIYKDVWNLYNIAYSYSLMQLEIYLSRLIENLKLHNLNCYNDAAVTVLNDPLYDVL